MRTRSDGNLDDADPGDQLGSARERIVIRDKRKIDSSGRAKTPEVTEVAATAAPVAAQSSGEEADEAAAMAGDSGMAAAPTAPAAPAVPANGSPDAPAAAVAGTGLGAELEALRSELDERLRDLQRVTAEYANYRKRVERDRGVVLEQATAMVIGSLLPVLDDLDRAREHGDLVGPFAAVAEQLIATLGKFGLSGFAEPGDAFDPTRHEAVTHETSNEVSVSTCTAVMRRGYLLGERLLRPALVAVADPPPS